SVTTEAAGTVSTASATPRHHRARAQPSANRAVMRVTGPGSPSQVSEVKIGEVRPRRPRIQWSTEVSNGPARVCPAYLIPRAATTATQTRTGTVTAPRGPAGGSGGGGGAA